MQPTPACFSTKKAADQTLFLCIFALSLVFLSVMTPVDGHTAITQKQNTQDLDFPVYPVIKPNVDFWTRIFTSVSRNQALVHDTRDLSLVYATINLDGSRTAAASKKNRKIKKKALKKYKTLLLRLASGASPVNREEKKILALFNGKVHPERIKRAAYNIRIQTGISEDFRAGLIRSGAFIERFKKTFAGHGIPTDLAWLPCVESSFRTDAYSKFGAAGIWQFTRSTGRRYMNIGYVVDERRDPFIATDAAARLLKKNFSGLKSWPLAITAYNHGLNGMLRALKAKGSYETIYKSYRSRSFKFASRNFYSEFLAARHVANNFLTYFGPLNFDSPQSFYEIRTNGFLSVKDIINHLKVSKLTLKQLNPALRKPVFEDQKFVPMGFLLKLPINLSRKQAKTQLAGIYRDKQKPSRFHRVQKGDTAGAIARLHSVSLKDLILANGLNRRATIYIGQNLNIPVKGEPIVAETAVAQKTESPVKSSSKKTLKKQVPPAVPKPDPDQIAKEPPAVDPPSDIIVNPNIVTSDLKILKTITNKGQKIGFIRVEAEETLGHYADWLGIKTNTIRKLNNLKYGVPISIDQTVKLPLTKISMQDFEEKRYEFHKEIEEDFFESFVIQGTEKYTVQAGDNIWGLCLNELEVPFWLLKAYNPGTRFQRLHPNQTIVYPVIEKRQDRSL